MDAETVRNLAFSLRPTVQAKRCKSLSKTADSVADTFLFLNSGSSVLGLSDLYPRTAETKIRQDRSLSCFFLAGPIVELIADLSIIHATN